MVGIPFQGGKWRTRNNIFRSPIERIRYYSSKDTDILQEYFIPPQNFVPFVNGLRDIVERRRVDLLDATVRYIEPNNDAFLSYSDRPALAVVLYMNVKTSASALAESSAMTREVIDLTVRNSGTFYLPYVLDYDDSHNLFLKAYPMARMNSFKPQKSAMIPWSASLSDFYVKYSR